MGILEGKNILVTGVTMNTSIAYKVAEIAQAEGATVIVSNFGRAMSLTRRVVQKLDPVPPVLELNATDPEQLDGLADVLREHVDRIDGIVHAIAYANPQTALGGGFMSTGWDDVATALHTSSYSLVSLVRACKPLISGPASVVGLTFDGSLAWPTYDWMGVAKAALEAASRYMARYVGPEGIRTNMVSAGPVDTLAKKAIPGGHEFNDVWADRAPLGWDPTDATATAKAVVALLSDWFPMTTGEVIHVDGGLHATGA
ncbi:enoyl-ACP reductase FabI [Raineyella fluvialis]|uniref:Enoyl-[acyl-carrier-protein] reductase [NADH] n=1 Tax=Raineyella fluvialis TaxID=2662261 RepID=A0A5Q2FKT9_9ACTN|nr:enoyl-ACP reductase FabI [Raineyella fluvialis]QGF24956.1 enoyl-ACP reductase FabI [Raineyella fluvialis]